MAASIFRDNATIASRYLADQLTEPERMAYEAALAEDPEILRELEATARMKVGLDRLRSTGELQGLLRRSRFVQPQLLLAMVAAVAAVVIGISVWHMGPERLRPPLLVATHGVLVDATGRVLPIAKTYAMFRKRAQAYDAVIESPAARSAIELRVLPDAGGPTHYRASLARIRNANADELLASVGDLAPATDGFIEMYADSSLLVPGWYRLNLSREGADNGPGESFVIGVTEPHNASKVP